MIPHLAFSSLNQEKPIEKMGVPPLPCKVCPGELMQFQTDHVVDGAPLRYFGKRHKIISFRCIFPFLFSPV